jgi:hypothetical protein
LGPFVANHQEAACVYVTNGICFSSKQSVGGLGWKGTSHPSPLLRSKKIPFATYTLTAF